MQKTSMIPIAKPLFDEDEINAVKEVLESTVYPGVTEDIVAPILERESGMRCGIDFKIGVLS